MQNYIIRYVEDLKARIEPTGCSINTALTVILPTYPDAKIQKLREAAADLERILALELQRREEAVTPWGVDVDLETPRPRVAGWRLFDEGDGGRR